MMAAAESSAALGETINLGSGREISIGALADRILALLGDDGVTAQLEHDADRVRPAGSEVGRLCADTTKAQAILGWEPAVPLDEGLAITIGAIRADIESYPRVGTYQR
jgi:dTDP-glucose 4,6-dehydratase